MGQRWELWPGQALVHFPAYFVCRWYSRVKRFVIFKGTGKRISLRGRLKYDRRVGIKFQEKPWCNGSCMKH